jgi:glycosyltransferase involved in cell wall biosynthesis
MVPMPLASLLEGWSDRENPGMTISVIICTHNRAHFLKSTLHSLERMDFPEKGNLELVVVNNASSDDTPAVISEFAGTTRLPVRQLFEARLGKTYALNTAIPAAAGDVLAFIDDDHIVPQGYLEAVSRAAKENPVFGLFCGRIRPNWDGSEPEWVHDDTVYPIRPFPIPTFDLGSETVEVESGKGRFIPGAGNLVVRKSVFERVGLFLEALGPKGHNLAGGEDIEFVKRALRCGERLLYVPQILQYHQVQRSNLELSRLVKKAYLRSMATYRFCESGSNGGVPSYLYGQILERAAKAVFTFNRNARRYYLVRLAAVLGEIKGRRTGRTGER